MLVNLIAYLKRYNIHLECCLTSSLKTNSIKDIDKHPLKTFHKKKINFSINTDDPSIFNTSFQNEINLVGQTLQLNNDQIYEIMLNSLESSFASKKEKEKIKKILSSNWIKFNKEIQN